MPDQCLIAVFKHGFKIRSNILDRIEMILGPPWGGLQGTHRFSSQLPSQRQRGRDIPVLAVLGSAAQQLDETLALLVRRGFLDRNRSAFPRPPPRPAGRRSTRTAIRARA